MTMTTPTTAATVEAGTLRAHEPVLLEEALALLAPAPGRRYCDATVGYGGHARALLERSGPDGRVIGIDRDGDALAASRVALAALGDRVTLVHAPFGRVREVLDELAAVPVDGFLVDLGVSSPQLDRPERGFSFRRGDGPLDMRMDRASGETAGELLRRVDEDELGAILRDFGEERHARRIARAILRARDAGTLGSTGALAAVVARCVPGYERRKDPATRTFQALRIAVNRELEELDRFLVAAPSCLRPGGRLVVIAFHSLEDRIVKHRLREFAGAGRAAGEPSLRVLTKRPLEAGEAERSRNPRARSAKLRAAERIAP